MGQKGNKRRNATTKLEFLQKTLLAPFNHKKSDSARILSDCPCCISSRLLSANSLDILHFENSGPCDNDPRLISAATTVSTQSRASVCASSKLDFATIGRAPMRLGFGASHGITSRELQIVEASEELLEAEVPEPEGVASNVSLLRGFQATIPSADKSRTRRRQTRHVETPRLGLRKLGMSARGLMTEEQDNDSRSTASEEDVLVGVRNSKTGEEGRV